MAEITRTQRAEPGDKLRTHLAKLINTDPLASVGLPFQFAQVVEVDDKTSRLKVRVPLLDDILEDKELPWCLPMHNRQVDTAEVNSVVIIGIWDPKNPIVRFWFTSVTDKALKDVFDADSLAEELDDTKKVWDNISELTEKVFNHFPGDKGRDYIKAKKKKVNYIVGLRGKGKNALVFDKSKTTLIQNKGKLNESKLVLSEKVELLAKNLDLLSTDSPLRHKPVFADPLFTFMQLELTLLSQIVTVLSTVPALFLGIPCIISPAAAPLAPSMSALMSSFATLKELGKSTHIRIN